MITHSQPPNLNLFSFVFFKKKVVAVFFFFSDRFLVDTSGSYSICLIRCGALNERQCVTLVGTWIDENLQILVVLSLNDPFYEFTHGHLINGHGSEQKCICSWGCLDNLFMFSMHYNILWFKCSRRKWVVFVALLCPMERISCHQIFLEYLGVHSETIGNLIIRCLRQFTFFFSLLSSLQLM